MAIGELMPGGLAIIVRSEVEMNIGKMVETMACLGFFREGERFTLNGQAYVATETGRIWHVKGSQLELRGFHTGSIWCMDEIPMEQSRLMPLEGGSKSLEAERQVRSRLSEVDTA